MASRMLKHATAKKSLERDEQMALFSQRDIKNNHNNNNQLMKSTNES